MLTQEIEEMKATESRWLAQLCTTQEQLDEVLAV